VHQAEVQMSSKALKIFNINIKRASKWSCDFQIYY